MRLTNADYLRKFLVQGVLVVVAKKMGQRLVTHKTPQDLKDQGFRKLHTSTMHALFFPPWEGLGFPWIWWQFGFGSVRA